MGAVQSGVNFLFGWGDEEITKKLTLGQAGKVFSHQSTVGVLSAGDKANQPTLWLIAVARMLPGERCVSTGLVINLTLYSDTRQVWMRDVQYFAGAEKLLTSCEAPLIFVVLVFYVRLVDRGTTRVYFSNKPGDFKGHANAVILDRTDEKNWVLEHLEPWGAGPFSAEHQRLFDAVQETLKAIFPQFTYRNTASICPRALGPQSIEGRAGPHEPAKAAGRGGFCEFWSVFFMSERMRLPKLTSEEMMNKLTSMSPRELRTLIENHTAMIDAYFQQQTPAVQRQAQFARYGQTEETHAAAAYGSLGGTAAWQLPPGIPPAASVVEEVAQQQLEQPQPPEPVKITTIVSRGMMQRFSFEENVPSGPAMRYTQELKYEQRAGEERPRLVSSTMLQPPQPYLGGGMYQPLRRGYRPQLLAGARSATRRRKRKRARSLLTAARKRRRRQQS